MADLENLGVDLLRRLQGVAAIDEQRGAVGEHDGKPGGAGEARQPGETLAGGRHVFALMLVRARNDEAVEPPRRQFLTQQRDPRRARQAREILGGEPVAVVGCQIVFQLLERFGQGWRGWVGYEGVPGRADLGRRRQYSGDQAGHLVGAKPRSRGAQQMHQLPPVRCRRCCRHPILPHHTRSAPSLSWLGGTAAQFATPGRTARLYGSLMFPGPDRSRSLIGAHPDRRAGPDRGCWMVAEP